MTLPLVVAAECLKTARKNIPQSIVNTGFSSQGLAAFDPNNAQPEGLVLAAVEPYMSVANYISENRINPE
jgi:hypothetical protein